MKTLKVLDLCVVTLSELKKKGGMVPRVVPTLGWN